MIAAGQPSAQGLTLVRNDRYRWGYASYRHRGPKYVGSGYDGSEASGPCRYANWSHDHTGEALLERVELYFDADPARRAALLKGGRVDAAEGLTPGDAVQLERSGDFWIFTVPSNGNVGSGAQPDALRVARLDVQRLTAADVVAGSEPAVILHGARREVNCLSYGIYAWDPNFYETSIRALP